MVTFYEESDGSRLFIKEGWCNCRFGVIFKGKRFFFNNVRSYILSF